MGAPAKPIKKLVKTVTKIPKKVVKTATKIPKKIVKTVAKAAKEVVAPEPEVVEKVVHVEKEVPRPPDPADVVRISGGGGEEKGSAGKVRASRGARYRPVLTGPGGLDDSAKPKKKRLLGA